MCDRSLFLQTLSRSAVTLPARYHREVRHRPGPRVWSYQEDVLKLVLIVQPHHVRPGRLTTRVSGEA
jgi:hypothetical protein